MGLIVVASVDANVVLAAVAPAPASARLVAQDNITFEALEVLDQAGVVVRAAISVARNIAVNGILRGS